MRIGVPHTDGAVRGAGDQGVLHHGHVVHPVAVALVAGLPAALRRLRTPAAHRRVSGGCEEAAAVGGEGQGLDARAVLHPEAKTWNAENLSA